MAETGRSKPGKQGACNGTKTRNAATASGGHGAKPAAGEIRRQTGGLSAIRGAYAPNKAGGEMGRMDWMESVSARARQGRKILFSREDECLLLLGALLQEQTRRTVALWAFALAEETVSALEKKHPGERRPREALAAARMWAAGEIKMPAAQRAILDCHALARELADPADAARCHAVGQALSVVHTPRHAMGYPIYDLTAAALEEGLSQKSRLAQEDMQNCRARIEERVRRYVSELVFQAGRAGEPGETWADFMR